MKNYTILLFSILFALAANAQSKKNSTLAYAGDKRTFIYNVFKPCSLGHPDGKCVGVKMERQNAGESAWHEVETFSIPESYPEFESHLKYAKQVVFIKTEPRESLKVWTKFQKCYCFDSIAFYLSDQMYDIALNVILVDTTVQNNNVYTYRISQIDKDGKTLSSYITNQVNFPAFVNYNIPRYHSREANSLGISMSWYTKGSIAPKALRVYRKRESEMKFEISDAKYYINQKGDSVIYTVLDNNISANEMYYYTIAPTTVFGGGSNVRSDTIAITNFKLKDMMLPQLFEAHAIDKKNLIHLRWRAYKPEYLASIQIYRSTHYNKEYKQIGSASPFDTMFEDHSARSAVKYYYYLKMTDKLGHQSDQSVRVFGIYYSERQPRVPVNIQTTATAKGIEIKWRTDAPDITGYYVLRCKGIEGKMEVISSFIPYQDSSGFFIDTLKLNPSYVYGYTVQQENTSHILSPPSQISYIQPRNMVALFTPKQLQAIPGQKSIFLLWEDMRAINPGMKAYALYRKDSNKKEFVKLGLLPSQNFNYNDSDIAPGTSYEYAISVIDLGNNESAKSNTVKITLAGSNNIISPPSGLKAFVLDKGIQLEWSPSGNGIVSVYKVYRYKRGSKPELLSKVIGSQHDYIDEKAKAEELYFYYVTAFQDNGEESTPCKEVGVRGM